MSLASLEIDPSRPGSGFATERSMKSSRAPSETTLLALPSPETPSQTQRAYSSPSKEPSSQSLALAIPSSRSSIVNNNKESLMDGVLAVPMQAAPPARVTRYQNQLVATRPWLQAAIEQKMAGTEKGLFRTQSLPAAQTSSSSNATSQQAIVPRRPKSPNKKMGRTQSQKTSGWKKRLESEDDLDLWNNLSGMWLDHAEDEDPFLDAVKIPKQAHDILVPDSIKELNYWQAAEAFHVNDRKKRGFLDKEEFGNLLYSVCRGKECMTRQRSNGIYDDIDIDESGTMEKEEFMGWVFQTHNNYLAVVREKLETMDPKKVQQLFIQIDVDGNGKVDKDEFWMFVDKFSPGEMTRKASDELHQFIDGDLSGEIDLNEFLNWIHPGRELRLLMGEKDVDRKLYDENNAPPEPMKRSMLPKGLSALGSMKDDEEGFQDPAKPMMETKPGKPIVLLFTVGRAFIGSVNAVKKALRQVFGASQLKFDIDYDPNCMDSCTKVEAKIGRGIVLWQRDRMIQHKDDPFATVKDAETWIKDVLAECLPDVVSAANLRFQKRVQKNACFICGISLKGARTFYIEGAPLCSKECRIAFRKQLLGVT